VTNAKLGIWLCLAYILLYSGFIILNAFFPETMRAARPGGINGAILYGMGLIAAAVLTSFAYGLVASSEDAPHRDFEEGGR
jgi:uncharacterized membrane protein (DUF485 family)